MRKRAVAYIRTTSAGNLGSEADSDGRQRAAVKAYAEANDIELVAEFNDAMLAGTYPVDTRPGFLALLELCTADDVSIVLVDKPSRFARDLAVQLTGHALLRRENVELIAADAPNFFVDATPAAELIRQTIGAVAQFEQASLIAKLRRARQRKRLESGRCEGRKPVPDAVVKEARRLARLTSKTGKHRSLRGVAADLALLGYTSAEGHPYHPNSVKQMLIERKRVPMIRAIP